MVTLQAGRTIARINPEGAWVESLVSGDDQILFPLGELTNEDGESKKRGGMHVCLPNFGAGGNTGLAQHGFGRNTLWRVVSSESNKVELALENSPQPYEDMLASLVYELDESSLTANLRLENWGAGVLRFAPAFHPYFSIRPGSTEVSINENVYQLDSLAGTEFVEADAMTFKTSSKTIRISQENLSLWAIWTDLLGPYVCIEPTFDGYRFLEAPKSDELLAPGNTANYACKTEWS